MLWTVLSGVFIVILALTLNYLIPVHIRYVGCFCLPGVATSRLSDFTGAALVSFLQKKKSLRANEADRERRLKRCCKERTIIKKWKAKYLEGLQRAHSKKRKWRAEGAGFFIVTSSAAVSYCAFNLTLYLPCIFKWDMFNNHQLMHINFFTIVYS